MSKSRVIIVEDELIVATDLRISLCELDYDVVSVCSSGEEALAAVAFTCPDIVLMDIVLKGEMGGIEAAREIQAKHGIPVVFLTSHTDLQTIERALDIAPSGYILKPFDIKTLTSTMGIAVYKSRAEKQLKHYQTHLEELVRERTVELEDTIGTLRKEISERKRAEEALRASERKYCNLYQEFTTLLDVLPDVLLLLSPELDVIWANRSAAASVGLESRTFVGKRCYAVWYERTVPCEECYALESLVSGDVCNAHKTNPDGSVIEMRSFPIMDDRGEVRCMLVIGRDITEKIRLEELARRNYHLAQLGQISAGIAHEINNPNSFIMFNAEILRDIWRDITAVLDKYYEENGDFSMGGIPFHEAMNNVPELLSGIGEGSRRIKGIVDGLKEYAGQKKANLDERVEINRVIELSLVIVGSQIKKHTDRFVVDLCEGLPGIMGNANKLAQVIINLLMNALQALPDRGRGVFVSTSLSVDGDCIVVQVRDEGVGMTEEILKRIFDPFFTTRQESGGTGLGLAVSYSIVKEHNGILEFTTEPGRGTTAAIVLPYLKS
jgi:signal transduction histidine kinase/DNA-binding NarL/FixJ family response regulator